MMKFNTPSSITYIDIMLKIMKIGLESVQAAQALEANTRHIQSLLNKCFIIAAYLANPKHAAEFYPGEQDSLMMVLVERTTFLNLYNAGQESADHEDSVSFYQSLH